MPTYVYRCPAHGETEVTKSSHEAGRAEYCTACFLTGATVEMRRRYTAPRVQNLTASRDTLASWGRDMRVETGAKTLAQLVREREAQRRDPEQPGRAAAID